MNENEGQHLPLYSTPPSPYSFRECKFVIYFYFALFRFFGVPRFCVIVLSFWLLAFNAKACKKHPCPPPQKWSSEMPEFPGNFFCINNVLTSWTPGEKQCGIGLRRAWCTQPEGLWHTYSTSTSTQQGRREWEREGERGREWERVGSKRHISINIRGMEKKFSLLNVSEHKFFKKADLLINPCWSCVCLYLLYKYTYSIVAWGDIILFRRTYPLQINLYSVLAV